MNTKLNLVRDLDLRDNPNGTYSLVRVAYLKQRQKNGIVRRDKIFILPLPKFLRKTLGLNSTNLSENVTPSNATYFDAA